jgi:excisionase family DNA binding protein
MKQMALAESKRYIQPREAAASLDCPLPSFYRWLRAGRIPGVVRLGPKSIRIDVQKLEDWLQSGGYQGATP